MSHVKTSVMWTGHRQRRQLGRINSGSLDKQRLYYECCKRADTEDGRSHFYGDTFGYR